MRTALVLLLAAGVGLAAQDARSGPAAGSPLPGPFHPLNVTGAHAGNPHCLVCEYGLAPVAVVFCRSLPDQGKPLTALLQKLDAAVTQNARAGFKAFAVLLTDDVNKEETRKEGMRRLEDVGKGADLKNLILALDTAAGPADYKLSPDADVTVILYRELQVKANFTFKRDQLSDKDVSAVLEGVKQMLAGK